MMAVFLIACCALVVGSVVFYSWKYGITPTSTSPKVMRQLIATLPHLSGGEIVELGSGWGTLAFVLARKFPHCKITALEISPVPYFCSLLIAKSFAYKNLTIERRDFFNYPLHSTGLVVCYLYPGAMEKLKKKFEQELSPETYVISHTFAVPGWKPIVTVLVPDLYHTPIYLYQRDRVNLS